MGGRKGEERKRGKAFGSTDSQGSSLPSQPSHFVRHNTGKCNGTSLKPMDPVARQILVIRKKAAERSHHLFAKGPVRSECGEPGDRGIGYGDTCARYY